MRFLLRLDNSGRYSPKDCGGLSKKAFEVVSSFEADIGNLRVSSCAVEFDLLLTNENNLQGAIGALESSIGRLLTLRKLGVRTPALGKAEVMKLGLDLFNEERYWESHEALEEVWRTATGVEKEILHAFILLAASLVHLQKNEPDLAVSIMKRARAVLVGSHGRYAGIELDELAATLSRMVDENSPKFFKIPVTQGV